MGTEILSPIILPDILNGMTYVELLRNNLLDFLDVPLLERNKIILQQDDAESHNARIGMIWTNTLAHKISRPQSYEFLFLGLTRN